MKRLVAVLGLVLAALFVVVGPVAAVYNSISGTVVDANGNPWTHGGNVYLYRTSDSALIATCVLGTASGFEGKIVDGSNGTCDYGDDALNLFGSPASTVAGDEITVYISIASGPEGSPAEYTETTTEPPDFIQEKTWQLGYISTGTGPNAVTLAGLGGQSWPLLALVLPLAAGVLLAGHNKHRKSQ